MGENHIHPLFSVIFGCAMAGCAFVTLDLARKNSRSRCRKLRRAMEHQERMARLDFLLAKAEDAEDRRLAAELAEAEADEKN